MRQIWRQLVLVFWIAAVLAVYWIVEPASGFNGAAARFEFLARAEAVLKPIFYRDYVF